MTDLIVGMAILTVAIMPLAYSFIGERQMLRAEYYRSVAVEIVDGEMEILAAGAWRDFPEGLLIQEKERNLSYWGNIWDFRFFPWALSFAKHTKKATQMR